MKISAIIPAAGSGTRFGSNKNKLLENINGMPVIIHTLQTISSIDAINEIIICTSDNIIDEIKNLVSKYNISKVKQVILGGVTRQESVFKGLKTLNNPDIVIIHDGARPLITRDIIENSIKTATEKGAAIVAVPTKDTIKRVNKENRIIETLNREELWNIQTPQVFNYKDILEAHIKFQGQNFTDDSALIEALGMPSYTVMGSYKNIKITTQEDIKIAEVFITSRS
ncbi:MAG: 2-C-methyl-D-erythritol 4-phosphate cytidylyltransferase [Candidatus Melainabacteria bacterium RIFOXYA12_FULL_32_12]|nr:MAG: 2-C-methyl-D-erythritol 4-phosphate cytidylyltransferase [Candidatus Melainabacteria bacterium RIFOXYA2_FULL_32_9]OGI31685.1 MAG: 2-C-methyl-D-erythritol 4-phosphate cytidylyltransferase [Candidatus Melainabacteria bacterium RIFOXYA12_FULL_32_12]